MKDIQDFFDTLNRESIKLDVDRFIDDKVKIIIASGSDEKDAKLSAYLSNAEGWAQAYIRAYHVWLEENYFKTASPSE